MQILSLAARTHIVLHYVRVCAAVESVRKCCGDCPALGLRLLSRDGDCDIVIIIDYYSCRRLIIDYQRFREISPLGVGPMGS